MNKNTKLQALKKAILYLKRKEIVHTNLDVSAALNISSSYLSQMLHGKKTITDSFYSKFESHFKINLNDPFSFTDLDWVSIPGEGPVAPENKIELFDRLKSLLLMKDEEIEIQRKLIKTQQQLISVLQKEIASFKPL